MPETFDAYQKWLGIPPDQQPPHPYRLLGIELFEDDPDTIDNAADRQMAHVRSFQSGQYGALSQRILNEIADARVKLLNPQHKAAIDARLRRAAPPTARPFPTAQPVPTAPPAAGRSQPPAAAPMPLVDTSDDRVQRVAKRKKPGPPLIVAQIAGGGVLAVVLVMLLPWWVFGADPFGLAGVLPEAVSFLAPSSLRNPAPPPAPPAPADGKQPTADPGPVQQAAKNPFENVITENQLSPQARGAAGLSTAGGDPFQLPGAPN